jgi:hypothetical protein
MTVPTTEESIDQFGNHVNLHSQPLRQTLSTAIHLDSIG